MKAIGRLVGWAFLVAGAILWAAPVLAAEPESVFTLFRVLVGRPDAAASQTTVLDLPGPFVRLGRSPEQEATDVLQLMGKLKEAYRLAEIEIAGTSFESMGKGRTVAIGVPGGAVRITVALLAADDRQAAYAVTVEKDGEKPSVAQVAIARGERGFIGTRDGARAPYVFLTVEPFPAAAVRGPAPVVLPKLVERVAPVYPEGARQAKVSGVVILECTVDAQGAVRDLKPLRTEPMGLTEAAIAAVSRWRYEPARDSGGTAIAAPMTLTISFRLE